MSYPRSKLFRDYEEQKKAARTYPRSKLFKKYEEQKKEKHDPSEQSKEAKKKSYPRSKLFSRYELDVMLDSLSSEKGVINWGDDDE